MNFGEVGRDSQGGLMSLFGAWMLVMPGLHGEEFPVPGHVTALRLLEVEGQDYCISACWHRAGRDRSLLLPVSRLTFPGFGHVSTVS